MLNRRDKRRYIAIWNDYNNDDHRKTVEAISKRSSELFGHIATEKAKIRFIDFYDGKIIILSCRLEMLRTVLSTIVLMQPPMILLRISGTLRALRALMARDAEKFLCAFMSTDRDI